MKLFPDIYHFGFNSEINKFYLIMEKYEYTASQYLTSCTIDQTNLFITKVISNLELLSHIKFRHGDLTMRNIMVSSDGEPIFIDFGYSSFKLNSFNLFFGKAYSKAYGIVNYHIKYDYLDNVVNNALNICHDIFILIYSAAIYLYDTNPTKFKGLMNIKGIRYFNDGRNIFNLLSIIFPAKTDYDVIYFHGTFIKIYFDTDEGLDLYKYMHLYLRHQSTLYITNAKLTKYCIELPPKIKDVIKDDTILINDVFYSS